MFNINKKSKEPTLYQKKALINNDITISDYDPLAVFTIITIPTLLMVSMKIFMMTGSF